MLAEIKIKNRPIKQTEFSISTFAHSGPENEKSPVSKNLWNEMYQFHENFMNYLDILTHSEFCPSFQGERSAKEVPFGIILSLLKLTINTLHA